MRRLVLATVALVALAGSASAQAEPFRTEIVGEVTEDVQSRAEAKLSFDFGQDVCREDEDTVCPNGRYVAFCDTCEARLVVTFRGRTIINYATKTGEIHKTKQFNCKSTGLYRWAVYFAGRPEDETSYPTYPETQTGSYRVGRCERERARRISRGTAQRKAAGLYPSEFVSRNRCKAASKVVNGRSSSWFCDVTHNNTYRECRSTIQVFSTTELLYGERKNYTGTIPSGNTCRDY